MIVSLASERNFSPIQYLISQNYCCMLHYTCTFRTNFEVGMIIFNFNQAVISAHTPPYHNMHFEYVQHSAPCKECEGVTLSHCPNLFTLSLLSTQTKSIV